jgi:tetratricopeptide (TPR) repeat protein
MQLNQQTPIFGSHRQIGTQLAKALSLRLNETELKRIAHRYTTSVAAYDLFLKAQSELLVRSASNNERARELYLQAVSLDPAFARAYSGLALIYAGNYRNQWVDDREPELHQALKFANSAKEIDPTLPEIHWVLGYVKTQQRRHSEAAAHLDDALKLDPRFADALALKGGIKTYTGRPAETIPLLRQAMRLNPAAGYLYFMTLVGCLVSSVTLRAPLLGQDKAHFAGNGRPFSRSATLYWPSGGAPFGPVHKRHRLCFARLN